MVGLISRGLSNASDNGRVIWISPVAGDHPPDQMTSDARLSVTRVHVPEQTHDDYYLTVGAGRVWMAFHGLSAQLAADALEDVPWQRFAEVNRRVAAAAIELAPAGSRVTVHDYTLLLAAPEIRRLRGDVSLVYVHHIPWPNSGRVTDAVAREMLRLLAVAAASCDAVFVSAQQWKSNLGSWSTGARVRVAHPGIDPHELKRRAQNSARDGRWPELVRRAGGGPIVAAVGRTDPCKNFDLLLRAWAGLVADGVSGTLCLHLIPTSRRAVPAYRDLAQALVSIAQETNRIRQWSVVIVEREAQDDALQLLQQADVVVACSRSDGWNLVAVEACALGADSQRLILSSQVGAAELLGPMALIVDDPLSELDLASAIRRALEGGPRHGAISRRDVKLPTPEDWWSAIGQTHDDLAARAEPLKS
jgi:trehalose-6-phosphate synthase